MTQDKFDDLFYAGEFDSYYETWLMVKLGVTLEEAIKAAGVLHRYEEFRAEWVGE